MARRTDDSGVPNTCPLIDDVIHSLASCECGHLEQGNAISALEQVRGYNDDLRTWGNEQYQELQEAEKRIERLKSDNDDLRSEIDDLKDEIKGLNKEIRQLES
jgi:predicted RNase H-like nuclease (RuvC/YqgF family)